MREISLRSDANITVVTPAARDDLPITAAEARAHSNIYTLDDDALLERFIRSARNWMQPPKGFMGVSVSRQTLRIGLPCWWYSPLRLPFGPLASVSSIKYFDTDNMEVTLDPSNYFLDEDQLLWTASFNEPQHYERPSAVRVEYVTGYENAAAMLAAGDDPIALAIHMLVAHWYANREAVAVVGELNMIPESAPALLATYRRWY